MCKHLISHGAQIDHVNSIGENVLFEVARRGNFKVFEMLVEYGASCSVANNEGETLRNVAAQEGTKSIVDIIDR